MMLWAAAGVGLFFIGALLLVGTTVVLTNKDAARVMDIEMTKGMLVTIVVISTLFVYGGYAMLAANLLAAASVLQ